MYEPANVAERINKLLKEKNLQQKDMLMECGLNKIRYPPCSPEVPWLRPTHLPK